MKTSSFAAVAIAAAIAPIGLAQSPVRSAPRPPVPVPGAPPEGSAAPDGYAPIPQWLGQTRAPHPAPVKASPPFEIETAVTGLNGAFCFSFLPDGRILVGERPGRIKIVSKDGAVSEVGGLPSNLYARNGLFEVRADRAFATNRVIYVTYLVLPEGVDPAKVRSPGVLVVARATL
ncbi:MAG TPA: PQQ-dependent sugar dehydrogenase, partial [Vicinamibacterales bacterium]|nr:PQQ-dependent sugar dehydrogenase [Vicinamibacterales bacterium]